MMLTLPCDITAWPPKTDDISITTTFAPPRPSSSAADNPDIPAPTTTASGVFRSTVSDSRVFDASDELDADELAFELFVDGDGDQQPLNQKSEHRNSTVTSTLS